MFGLRCHRPVPLPLKVLHTQATFPGEGISDMVDGRDRSNFRLILTLKPTLSVIVMSILTSDQWHIAIPFECETAALGEINPGGSRHMVIQGLLKYTR